MICSVCNKTKYIWVTRDGIEICKDCDNMRKYEEGEEGFFICPLCGKADSPNNYIGGLPKGLCFHCSFWDDKIDAMKDRPGKFVSVNGSLYFIGEELPKNYKGFKGFGGTKFVIERFDGTTISTENLWHNGRIPDRFRKFIPDNAKFIRG